MKLDFPIEEYQGHCERAVRHLNEAGLDALMVTAEANVAYFSGFRHFAPWTTFTRPMFFIITEDHDPVLIVQGFLREDAARDSWVKDVRGYATMLGTPVDMLTDVFQELNLAGKRVGAELGYEQRLGLSLNDFVQLQTRLQPIYFVDASHFIWDLRMIKTEAEISAHRRACEVAAKAFSVCYSQASEGMTEKDVARLATQTVIAEGGEPGFTIMCSGPGNYGRVAGMPTDRILQTGDLIWFDMGVVANGYWCDFCRAGVVGGATGEQARFQEVVVNITHKTLETVRPGIKASELARACGKAAEGLGIDFSFEAGRLGHGMGLMSTEPPHIAVYDDTRLQAGMVITLEPGLVTENGTFIAEENLVIRPDGYELLSMVSRELRTL